MADIRYYDVILKPVVTEKSMDIMADKKYTFLVHPEVNTMNNDGKTKRRGRTEGKTVKTKKAIVTLTENSKEIEVFAGL